MALDRTWYNTLVDDDGSGMTGSVWDKADVDALMDAVDAQLATSGLWTPRLGSAGGQAGQTYAYQFGEYTRIGDRVLVYFNVALSGLGTVNAGTLQIQGLPFAILNLSPYYGPTSGALYWSGLSVAYAHLVGLGAAGTTAVNFYGTGAAATGLSAVPATTFTASTSLAGSLMYRASA